MSALLRFWLAVCRDVLRISSRAMTLQDSPYWCYSFQARSWSSPCLADYILRFRKPGENPIPIKTDYTRDEWINLAHACWYGIEESDTLSVQMARESQDEAHLCPLQLETIRRCIRLWSNRNETVFSPFAGIGSEGFVALEQERRFVGIELKESYWKQAVKNLRTVGSQESLFAATGD